MAIETAAKDPNYVSTLMGVDLTTGKIPTKVYVDETTHRLLVSANFTGSAIPVVGATTAQPVAIVDASGNQIASFGGGTQYTQGGATAANPTGTASIWFDGSNNPKAVTPTQPQPSNLTDGTNIANVVAGASGNGLQVAYTSPTPTSFSISSVTTSAVVDCANYSSISIQITAQGTTSTVTPQWSDDNTNWVNGIWLPTTSANVGSNTTATGIFNSQKLGRYFRLSITGISGGTTAGTIIPFSNPMSSPTASSITATGSATGSAVPANAFYMAGNLAGNLTGATLIAPNDAQAAQNGIYTTSELQIYNGTNYDRTRSATAASNTTGTGLLGAGILAFDGTNYQKVKVDSNTNVLVSAATQSAAINVGQQTVSTTAVQVSAASTVPTNGIIIRALSTNAAPIYVGGSGVTTSNGYELVAGESISFSCNLNTIYIRSASSTTDKICWNVE